VRQAEASATRGSLESLQRQLGLLSLRKPSADGRQTNRRVEAYLAREPRFRVLWQRLRRCCGPSLPAYGDRWLGRQLRFATTAIVGEPVESSLMVQAPSAREQVLHAQQRRRQAAERRLNQQRFTLRQALDQFSYRCARRRRQSALDRWLQRRLRPLRHHQRLERWQALKKLRQRVRRCRRRLSEERWRQRQPSAADQAQRSR
jgi:hypothetical protein